MRRFRYRSFVLMTLLMVAVVVTTTGIATILAQNEPATPVAVESTAMATAAETDSAPTTSLATSSSPVPDDQPSPVATPQLSAEECDEALAFHRMNQERGAGLQIAYNEVGIGAGFSDPADVDLDPTAARELVVLIESVHSQDADQEVPPAYQEFFELFAALDARFVNLLVAYADAVESGQNPDDAMAALFADPELNQVGADATTAIFGLLDACGAGSQDVESAREYAALSDAAASAQASADIPAVAQEANDAVVAFLTAMGAAWAEYVDRVEAGEDPAVVINEVAVQVEPFALPADDELRGLLEGCGLVIGVPSVDQEIETPLTADDCQQVFTWYVASAERFAELNAALRASGVNLGEVGIALPGNLGSVDPDEFPSPAGPATPTITATAGATPIADEPDSGSPVATPVVSDEDCLAIIVWHAYLLDAVADYNVAVARSGVANAITPEEKALVDLDAETARDLARLLERYNRDQERLDIPDVAREAKETRIAATAALAAAFVAYTDAVEGGADPDDALVVLDAAVFGTAATEADEAGVPLFAACGYIPPEFDESIVPRVSFAECTEITVWIYETINRLLPATIALAEVGLGAPGDLDSVQLDSKAARDTARLLEKFVREQDQAAVPEAAVEANDIVIANYREFAAALVLFAETLDDGGDPEEALDALLAKFTPLEAEASGQLAALQACAGNTIAENKATPESNG